MTGCHRIDLLRILIYMVETPKNTSDVMITIFREEPWPGARLFAGAYINQSELARVYGLDRTQVCRILSGKRRPSLKYTRRIAEALDMSIEDLLIELDKLQPDTASKLTQLR